MLTDKQERFAQCIALEGMSNSDAYRAVYDVGDMKRSTIHTKAYEEVNKPKVAKRIEELKEQAVSPKIMSAIERKIWLSELIKSEEEKKDTQLKALDILNKMDGEYVQKIEAEVNNEVTICVELVDDEE